MRVAPTADEIAIATSVLRRLTPEQLSEYSELREAGCALFKRDIVKAAFSTDDAVAYLKKQSAQRQTLKELRRLSAHIAQEHAAARERAATCGINAARKETLELIKAECLELEREEGALLMAPVGFDKATAHRERLLTVEPRDEPNLDDECDDEAALEDAVAEQLRRGVPPRGDFTTQCNVCRGEYLNADRHHFYHQLCPRCADFNYEKRFQTADLTGYVAVVTGGRVRIGYATVLKLLRAGATVVTTSRFPADAAARYAREADFDDWRERLEVFGPLELANIKMVETFCDVLTSRFARIHFLINNAAQTLTRPEGWFTRQSHLEERAAASLPKEAKAILNSVASTAALMPPEKEEGTKPSTALPDNVQHNSAAEGDQLMTVWEEASSAASLADFPACRLDESRQPLDLSTTNSWSRRLGEVPTLEMLQTLAANAAAPFVLVSRLAPLLSATADGEEDTAGGGGNGLCSHVINVSAVEGKFSVPKKMTIHPHTNMGKAALNMMTFTSAPSLYQQHRILMNCVDTGWVTDMAPGGVGKVSATHETWVATPLDEIDGAARVLDPIFCHVKEPKSWRVRGRFFRNYYVAGW